MLDLLRRYTRWLHTRWPAGTVEPLPLADEHGATNIAGLFIAGDLTGVPLLKFAADSGARVVRTIVQDPAFQARAQAPGVLDLIIVGAGVSGLAAAAEAGAAGLRFEVLEATEPLSTLVNFPRAKPIYTYPIDMTPAGAVQFGAATSVKEGLVDTLRAFMQAQHITPLSARAQQVRRAGGVLEVQLHGQPPLRAHRVIACIGRSGNFRNLGIPGENLDKVYNRLHNPADFRGRRAAVVGGGDSALETAIALVTCGCDVTLIHRQPQFSRPKPENSARLQALVEDPAADVAVEQPNSERVTAAAGPWLGAARTPGRLALMMSAAPLAIRAREVDVRDESGRTHTLPNDVVFSMIGREPPLDFFRRSGVRIRGEWRPATWAGCIAFTLFCVFLYHWKSDIGLPIQSAFKARQWFPFNLSDPADPATLAGTLRLSAQSPSFYYSLAYCLCVLAFGLRRIRRRKTPYVRAQTWTLIAVQWIPLFLLPYFVLPWLGHRDGFGTRCRMVMMDAAQASRLEELTAALPEGPTKHPLVHDALSATVAEALAHADAALPSGATLEKPSGQRLVVRTPGGDAPAFEAVLRLAERRLFLRDDSRPSSWLADALFPASEWSAHGREYWRSVGFILAWPLLPWNVFTSQPLAAWLVIAFLQTFVIIPLIIYRWGKGAYCGWICSCGALAETMGDAHRHKMPHGPVWNRVNMIGQVFLLCALLLLVLRVVSWITPGSGWADSAFAALFEGKRSDGSALGGAMTFLNYAWFVDLLWAGILGVCLYFWFSGRVWCRFACPLAALMHIYARFSRFRIAADKKKCISCNVCTAVCHQGIDVMNFANKGEPMADPQCVRCSACVQSCPTGVLEFVQINLRNGEVLHRDRLAASPLRFAEVAARNR